MERFTSPTRVLTVHGEQPAMVLDAILRVAIAQWGDVVVVPCPDGFDIVTAAPADTSAAAPDTTAAKSNAAGAYQCRDLACTEVFPSKGGRIAHEHNEHKREAWAEASTPTTTGPTDVDRDTEVADTATASPKPQASTNKAADPVATSPTTAVDENVEKCINCREGNHGMCAAPTCECRCMIRNRPGPQPSPIPPVVVGSLAAARAAAKAAVKTPTPKPAVSKAAKTSTSPKPAAAASAPITQSPPPPESAAPVPATKAPEPAAPAKPPAESKNGGLLHCGFCTRKFSNATLRDEHEARHVQAGKTYQCDGPNGCGRTFASEANRDAHLAECPSRPAIGETADAYQARTAAS
jgi:hypothetical protein